MTMYFSASRTMEAPPAVHQQPNIQRSVPQASSSNTQLLIIGYLIVAVLCFVISILLPRFI